MHGQSSDKACSYGEQAMAKDRRQIKRDSLGRRTGHVKRRELNEMRRLHIKDGLDLNEIAQRLDRDLRTVKVHLGTRAHRLSPLFEQHLDGHPCWSVLKNVETGVGVYATACGEAYNSM